MEPNIRKRSRPAVLLPTSLVQSETVGEAVDQATIAADYEIGKNKPPVHTRFGQPGGNRPGRKPKAKGFVAISRRELATKVTFVVNGKEQRLTKEELIARAVVNDAVKGDFRKLELLVKYNILDVLEKVQAGRGRSRTRSR